MGNDMLAKLYDLPDPTPVLAKLRESGVDIRRGIPPETHIVTDWVRRNFNAAWAS